MARFIAVWVLFLVVSIVTFSYYGDGDLFVAPHVEQFMNETSEQLHNEIMACLDYIEIGNKVIVIDYRITVLHESTPMSASGETCDIEEIVYHNHPSQRMFSNYNLRNYYEQNTGEKLSEANQLLYMSAPDMQQQIILYKEYNIVGANGEWAWWTFDQVYEAYFQGIRLLKPIEGQSTLPTSQE